MRTAFPVHRLILPLLVVLAATVAPAVEPGVRPPRTTITVPGMTVNIDGDAEVDAVVSTSPIPERSALRLAMALILFALLVLFLAWLIHRGHNRTLEPDSPFPNGGPPHTAAHTGENIRSDTV